MKASRLNFIFLFLLLFVFVLLSGCSNNESVLVVESKHPETDQSYKILGVHTLYEDFIQQSEESSPEDMNDLYVSKIIEPVYEACFETIEYGPNFPMVTDVPSDLSKIQEVIDYMDFEHMSSLIEETLVKSSDLLPSEDETTICVFPALREDNNPGMFATYTGKIVFNYSELYYQDERIQAGIAHEYHHTLRSERSAHIENKDSFTVLDTLILEGKAVMFEKILYPNSTFTPINRTYNKSFWSEIEPDLHKVDPDRAYEILGGGRGGVPIAYGYSEGYKMVEAYLELNPDLTPAEWYDVDARVIYEEGNYISNYE